MTAYVPPPMTEEERASLWRLNAYKRAGNRRRMAAALRGDSVAAQVVNREWEAVRVWLAGRRSR